MNENDLESPGYEYLRSYQSMNNLYHKLLILNYQQDFCVIYRCPPIHKFYFSAPSKNQNEQQFMFTCLCAWLIKDRCQMNLELEPEEYEDPNLTISVIMEALRLLLTPDEDMKKKTVSKNLIGFAPSRLKAGFGPEVIWTLNILADRALELMLELGLDKVSTQIVYHNTSTASKDIVRPAVENLSQSSITIGQPFVGGGLTTRPLGSYQIDDSNLLFEEDVEATGEQSKASDDIITTNRSSTVWYRRVENMKSALDSAIVVVDDNLEVKNWQDFLDSIRISAEAVREFLKDSKYFLEPILNNTERHLEVINRRERSIQINLETQIENFLKIWRTYSLELSRQTSLSDQITSRTDKFDQYNERLRRLNSQIDLRIKELNDGSRIRELELTINKLKEENDGFDIKIGLLLTVYARRQKKIIAEIGVREGLNF